VTTLDPPYCPAHQIDNKESRRRKAFDTFRRKNDPYHNLYSQSRWMGLAAQVRYEEPLCQIKVLCGGTAPTEDVDHVIPARVWVEQHGGDMESFYDRQNLQGACKRCHSSKTAREDSEFARRG
jgi:5-methylcytosine-specific restriction enzyme A